MNKWEEFEKLSKGLSLSDAIDSFFDYAEDMGMDSDTLATGVDYLAENGKVIMSTLISMEVLLAVLPEETHNTSDLDPVVRAFVSIKEVMNDVDHENNAQVLECLEDLRESYPIAFAILDERTGTA
ncbi:MAG: hypothetical protein ACKUBY_00065 [Candidatus Moraniibacteriota bacterium]